MRNEPEKRTKVRDDLSVVNMEQQAVTERPIIKKITETAPKSTKVSRVCLKQYQIIQTIMVKKNRW